MNGDCSIYYECFGSPDHPTLLLVNGLGSQCINYDEAWCELFAAEGFQVIRFDNRDVGLTTHYGDAPVDDSGAAYTLRDMADDAVAVLDAVGVERAHVMGLSMGGMIVQQLAIHHRDRLLTMTSVMSRTGEREYGQSTPEAYALLTAPPVTDPPAPSADCLIGSWVITQDEMNAFYDTLEATVGAPLDITVSGQTLLDLTADTYEYTANFDLVVSALGTSGEGQSSGTVSGTYTADDGVIVTTLGSSNLSVIVTVGGQTLDESAFANGLLGSVPINDAPYDCSGPTPVIMFETADPGVRHPVTLTPA